MNKKVIYIIIGFVVTVLLSVGITLNIVLPKKNQKTNEKKVNNEIMELEKQEQSFEFEVDDEESLEEDKKQNEKVEVEHKQQEETKSNKDIVKDESNIIKDSEQKEEVTEPHEQVVEPVFASEAEVVSYVEGISKEEDATLKEGFVKVIDFLFYGGEISGKTFSELSAIAKLKIVAAAIKIDSKIEEYFPEYKENISNSTNRVYTNVKSKAIEIYLDTTVKVCSENTDLCKDAKAGLNDLKKSFGITWDFIKDISGIGLTKLKNWYEVWREE